MVPRVSIVIPMFNAQEYLAAAVDSVRRQRFEDWELVLFDDGSRDRTLSIAHECARDDSRIRVIEGVNGGTASARNRGYAATNSGSEFVIFLDNDDIWEPEALASLVQALEENPECPAAHGLGRSVDQEGHQIPGDTLEAEMADREELRDGRLVDLPRSAPTTFEALLIKNYPVTPGTTLVRRGVRESIGDFEPSTVPCDDWDMNIRVARAGGIVLVDRVILNWRRHPGAGSHTTTRWRDAYLQVRQRTVMSAANTPTQRGAAIAAFRREARLNGAYVARQLLAGNFGHSIRTVGRWLLFQRAWSRAVRAGQAVPQPRLNRA